MSAKIDMKGRRIGRLTVIREAEKQGGHIMWLCKCDCGKEVIATGDNLRRGCYKSCGCYSADRLSEMRTKHKMSNTRLYREWAQMKGRCYYKKYINYDCYGERGITVCAEWKDDFSCFMKWALSNGYNDNLTLDRIDNNKGYSPDNCRWITGKEQANNRRNNHYVTYNGITKTISQWSESSGINYWCLRSRIANGWDISEALTKPSRGRGTRRLSKA